MFAHHIKKQLELSPNLAEQPDLVKDIHQEPLRKALISYILFEMPDDVGKFIEEHAEAFLTLVTKEIDWDKDVFSKQ